MPYTDGMAPRTSVESVLDAQPRQINSGATLQVYEGEDACTDNNVSLGKFELPVPPAPAGAATVTVTMAVGEDSLLNVNAVDNKTGDAAIASRQTALAACNSCTSWLLLLRCRCQ